MAKKKIENSYKGFVDSLRDLRSTLFGKSVVSIDSAIEKVTTEIVKQRRFDTTTVIELSQTLTNLQKQENNINEETRSLTDILKEELRQKTIVPGSRIGRYKKIDYVVDTNPQVAQALKIYIDNILSSDIYTKTLLDILCKLPKVEDSSIFDEIENLTKSIINTLKIEDLLYDVTSHFCQYGDAFVEIENPKEELIYSGVLRESNNDLVNIDVTINSSFNDKLQPLMERYVYDCKITENQVLVENVNVVPLTEDYTVPVMPYANKANWGIHETPEAESPNYQPYSLDSPTMTSKESQKRDKKVQKTRWLLDNIRLKLREPWNVIKLEVDGVIFGYLISETTVELDNLKKENSIAHSVVERISRDILSKISQVTNNEELANNPHALNIIYDLIKTRQIVDKTIKTRFITPDRMQAFTLTPSKYRPYGQTVLAPVLETAHLLTTLRQALVLYRLARAPEKRVVNVETGLSRDAAAVVEQAKQALDKKEITADKLGSIDTVSTILSMFETIYLPMTDGKKWVEFDVLSGGQLTDKIDDINFVLKEVLSGLGVPPALLGYEQDIESKATLSQQHIRFARTITQLQKLISSSVTELILKVFKLVYPEQYPLATETLNVVLKPPTVLLLNSLSEKADQLQKFVEVLKGFDYPTYKIIAYFLGDIIDAEELAIDKDMTDAKSKILGQKEGEEGEGGEPSGSLF